MINTAPDLLNILLVEDNPADADLTREALLHGNLPHTLTVVEDGEKAMRYLRSLSPYDDAPRPDLILLDLNLPRRNGKEVLDEIKRDPKLRVIPVIMLSTSSEPHDIRDCYKMYANCYVVKPQEFNDFRITMAKIEEYWSNITRLATFPRDGGKELD